MPDLSTFKIIGIIGACLAIIAVFAAFAVWPPSKDTVLNALFRKKRALTCHEIAKELNPFHPYNEKVRTHLVNLIQDGDVKRLGEGYRITEKARMRLQKELDDMPPITLNNMP